MQNLKIKSFDFEKNIKLLRDDFEKVEKSDALLEVKTIYEGVLYFCIVNLHTLNRFLNKNEDKELLLWIEQNKGKYKKSSIDTLNIFRTNLLPETDYAKLVDKLKDFYLEILQADNDDDDIRELRKLLVLAMFSVNFTLFFESGEEEYSQMQEWLMDKEFGDIL